MNRDYIYTLLSNYNKDPNLNIEIKNCDESNKLCRRGMCGLTTINFIKWLLKKGGKIYSTGENKNGIKFIKINNIFIKKLCFCEFQKNNSRTVKCNQNICAKKFNNCGHFALLFSDNSSCEISENDILVDYTYKQMIWRKNENNIYKENIKKLPNFLIIRINDLDKSIPEIQRILNESGYDFTITTRFLEEIINVNKFIIDIGNISFSGGKLKNDIDYSKYTVEQLRKIANKNSIKITKKEGGYYRKRELISKINKL